MERVRRRAARSPVQDDVHVPPSLETPDAPTSPGRSLSGVRLGVRCAPTFVQIVRSPSLPHRARARKRQGCRGRGPARSWVAPGTRTRRRGRSRIKGMDAAFSALLRNRLKSAPSQPCTGGRAASTGQDPQQPLFFIVMLGGVESRRSPDPLLSIAPADATGMPCLGSRAWPRCLAALPSPSVTERCFFCHRGVLSRGRKWHGGAGWAPRTDVTFPHTATRAWETAVDVRQAVSLAHVLVRPGEPSASRRAAIPVAGLTQWHSGQQLGSRRGWVFELRCVPVRASDHMQPRLHCQPRSGGGRRQDRSVG